MDDQSSKTSFGTEGRRRSDIRSAASANWHAPEEGLKDHIHFNTHHGHYDFYDAHGKFYAIPANIAEMTKSQLERWIDVVREARMCLREVALKDGARYD